MADVPGKPENDLILPLPPIEPRPHPGKLTPDNGIGGKKLAALPEGYKRIKPRPDP